MTRSGAVQAPASTSTGPPAVVADAERVLPRGPRRLGLWRLEWLRLVRTKRLSLLLVAYPGVGLIGPVFARHRDRIVEALHIDAVAPASGMRADSGMAVYTYAAGQIGILVGLALMASALAVDHRPGLAAFHRTRLRRRRDLVVPRYTVTTAAVSLAYLMGSLIAWAQVHWMFGPLPAKAVFYGSFYGIVGVVLEVSVVAAMAAFLRRPVAIFGGSLVAFVLMPVAALWRPLQHWLPSQLFNCQVDLLRRHTPGEYVDNLVVAVVLSALCVWLAVWRIGRREM